MARRPCLLREARRWRWALTAHWQLGYDHTIPRSSSTAPGPSLLLPNNQFRKKSKRKMVRKRNLMKLQKRMLRLR